jgi:hypothetical protein
MWRIKTPTRQQQKFGDTVHGQPRDGFTNGNPQLGLPSTQLEADFFDIVQEEVAQAIELGPTGEPLNLADMTQLYRAIGRIAAFGGPYLPLTGGTLTGSLVILDPGRLHLPVGIDYTGLPSGFANLIGFDWDGFYLRAFVDATYIADIYRDAPADGTIWGRLNNDWAQVPVGSGGIPEAPLNQWLYGRTSATWVSGGTFYTPGLSDTLNIITDAGLTARMGFATGVERAWRAGAIPGDAFMIGDDAGASFSVVGATRDVHMTASIFVAGAGVIGLDASVGGNLVVTGRVEAGVLNVSADASAGGNLAVTGRVDAGVLAVSADGSVGGTLLVGSNLTCNGPSSVFNGDLTVVNLATAGNVAAGAQLSGASALIGGTATINGLVHALTGIIDGDLAVGLNFTVGPGASIAGSTGFLTAVGGANIGNGVSGILCNGGLQVRGNAVLENDRATLNFQLGGDYRGIHHGGQLAFGGHGADGNPTPGQEYALMTAGAIGSDFGGLLTVTLQGFKPGGGEWGALIGSELIEDVQPYERGLDAVRQLNPVTYRHNGLAGLSAGRLCHGLRPDDVRPVMPEMLAETRVRLHIDDPSEPQTPTIAFDGTALTYALLNAVKELADRVDALEGRRR